MTGGTKMIRDIYERLGLTSNLATERSKVNQRLYLILPKVWDKISETNRTDVFDDMELILGKKIYSFFDDTLIGSTLEENLAIIAILLKILKERKESAAYKLLKSRLEGSINLSLVDLGIVFEKDMFIKRGTEILDKTAVLEPLQWLTNYPTIKKYFENALQYYLTKKYPDAMTNAYSALESIVKTVLNSNKRLDKLIPDLLSLLSLPKQWSAILAKYCEFAHEFSTRHGKKESETKDDIAPKDAEAYIYFTGLMIRLIIRTVEEKS
jgi:hypothetical protein